MLRYSIPLLILSVISLGGCPGSGPSSTMIMDGGEVLDQTGDFLQEDIPASDVVEEKGCTSDEECPGGVCNPVTHTCVECFTSKDCPEGFYCSKWTCAEATDCYGDVDCPDGLLCDEVQGVCVQCVEDADCPDGVCVEGSCRFGCDAGCPEGLVCDDLTNLCVECVSAGDCPEDSWCYVPENACMDDVCAPGAKGCVGNQTAVCSENGSGWTDLLACAGGFVCKQGECWKQEQCKPGSIDCADDVTVKVCSDDGLSWEKVPCGPGKVCVLGECMGDCVPLCAGKQCGPSECPGIECGKCKDGTYCGEDFQCHKGVCAPGQTKCVDGGVVECLSPDMGWSQPMACPPNSVCKDGVCQEVCIPECAGKQCGPDGCGGQCGWCPDGTKCSAAGKCEGPCVPKCQGKECGTDGCGGSCGVCPAGTSCNIGGICEWTCSPKCEGKVCGSDGCAGSCGICPAGEQCNKGLCVPAMSCKELTSCVWGCGDGNEECNSKCWQDASPEAKVQWMEIMGCIQQECGNNPDQGCPGKALQGACKTVWNACQDCTAACTGKQCGGDGCGGDCGNCPGGFVCDKFGTCLCQPQCAGLECGPDGCGGTCGFCPSGTVCNYKGHCVCMPKCENKQCGGDGCGGTCGTCPQGFQCTPEGMCKPAQEQQCGNGICQPGENCKVCPKDCSCEDCCLPHPVPGCIDPQITKCVCSMDKFCCQGGWDEKCVEMAMQCGAMCWCEPQCFTSDGEWKECGDDGCGGLCGICPDGMVCSSMGYCVQVGQSCGNGVCQGWKNEDCQTCPQDCGSCGCGDGVCTADEGCWVCPIDCGPCYEGDCCSPHDSPGCEMPELVECVCAFDEYCCKVMWDEVCVQNAAQCGVVCGCVPQCFAPGGSYKECGSDGCGGACGYCKPGAVCDEAVGKCVPNCVPNCQNKKCGDDGCGGVCGYCAEGEACQQGVCVAAPPYFCGDMVDCAIECGFSVSCFYGCYGSGSQKSKDLFQQLGWCVIQTCGWQIDKACIDKAFAGPCKEQYVACMGDNAP